MHNRGMEIPEKFTSIKDDKTNEISQTCFGSNLIGDKDLFMLLAN